ncbi:MAG: response regulator transcription factor [bacterium]
MKQEPAIAVAVVEDSASVLESLVDILGSAPGIRCVAACPSGEQALATLPALRPEVVLMDISLPGIDGVECVSRLVAKLPGVLVVMLTVHDDTEWIFKALAAGACGYLHKPVRAEELLTAVKGVHAGGSPMTGNIARKVVQTFIKPASSKTRPRPDEELTDRERAVLEYLAKGYQYKEIAEQMNVSWHTVHTHIRHIYEKLHVRSRGAAVASFISR